MQKNRLEAFSDGVIAIIITIMVLELRPPEDFAVRALVEILPKFISYVLSFLIIAVMWVNHHHVFSTVKKVDGRLLWWNINLLFWMSLIPFATAFLGEHYAESFAVAIYGFVLTFSTMSFTILRHVVSQQQLGNAELTTQNRRSNRKNLISNFIYLSSIPLAFISIYISFFIFALIPALYFLPEKELEKEVEKETERESS